MKQLKKTKPNRRLRVGIPSALIAVWLLIGAIGGPFFGKIEDVSTNDMATFLPASADSTKVNTELKKFRSSDTIPAIVVFQSDNELTTSQKNEIINAKNAVEDSRLASGRVSESVISDDKKAAFFIVPINSDSQFQTLLPKVEKVVDSHTEHITPIFTGPAMFSRDLDKAFAGIDGTLLFVALGVVFVILLVVYRSILLPIVTLLGASLALAAAIIVVWYLAAHDVILLNGQTQGILFILVIGAATDYALLYISRYREELLRNKSAFDATKITLKASFEPIIAAGGTVTLGLICLLASDLGSNKALGPVGGIGIVFSILSALTFLPAVLLLTGRYVFWPRLPKFDTKHTTRDSYEQSHAQWSKVGKFVGKYPRRVWISTLVILIVAALGMTQLQANGVSQEDLVLGASEARQGQLALADHFPAGSGSPALVLVSKADQNKAVSLLDSNTSVSSVSVLTTNENKSSMPVGKSRQTLTQEIKDEVTKKRNEQLVSIKSSISSQLAGAPEQVIDAAYDQAVQQVPSVDSLVASADPFKDTAEQVVDQKVLLQATLDQPGSSLAARDTVKQLRSQFASQIPGTLVGGLSAIQLDTNQASARDVKVVIPLILFAVTIILMLLLRSIIAPIILLITTVLSFAATVGIASIMFRDVFRFAGADPVVIIFGFVFLVALGIDYNIFLMTRVREETAKNGVRRGTLKALVVTGGVITSAGIVLASTFAALNVIPILFLAEISFIVAFGVLLDTIIVRSLLVPALTLEIGKFMWWPSILSKKGKK